MILITIAGAIIGAAANRHRGGWLPTGHTQLARLDFSLIMSALVWWSTGRWDVAICCIPAWAFGTLAGQGEGMWMGTGTSPLWRDALNLLGSGLWNVCAVAAVLWWFDLAWWPMVVAGAMKAAAYWIGNRVPVHVTAAEQGPELSEILYGAVLGVAVSAPWLPLIAMVSAP